MGCDSITRKCQNELNYGHPAGVTENCLLWGENLHTLVTISVKSKGFCVSNKGESQGRETIGENCLFYLFLFVCFSPHRKGKTEFLIENKFFIKTHRS